MGFYGIEHPNPTTAQFAFPRRGGCKLSGTAIVHTAEMYGALNTAAFCMRRSDYGCYHTVVDDKAIIEVYPYEYETWQDSETNNWAVGISAACRAADWKYMTEDQLEGYYRNLAWAAADFVKYMKEAYNIEVPLKRISGAEARNRKPGFCAHGDSGIARSDPGKDFDWDRFFAYTKEALGGSIQLASTQSANKQEDEDMKFLVRLHGEDAIWLSDGIHRRHVSDPKELEDIQWYARNWPHAYRVFDNANVQDVGSLKPFGIETK